MNNIFTNIPQNLKSEVFEHLVNTDNVKVERIISPSQHSPDTGWLDQKTNEWVIVLKGEAVLSYEQGAPKHLKTGDYINIPAHAKHRVEWTDPDNETIWLAIHY